MFDHVCENSKRSEFQMRQREIDFRPAGIIGHASAAMKRMAVGAWLQSPSSPPPRSEFQF